MSRALLRGLYHALGFAVVAALRAASAWPPLSRDPGRRRSLQERLGRWPGGAPAGDWVWVHAASVGEARLAAALVAALESALEGGSAATFVVTCQTANGCRTASAAGLANVHYFPVDAVAVVRPLVTSGRLLLYVSIETELWPTLLAELARAGVAAAIANARISSASFARYRWIRALLAPALAGLAAVCARDAVSAARLRLLGCVGPDLRVTGDIKFDLASAREQVRKPLFVVDQARPVLVAASTHEGEEEVVLEAFELVRREQPGVRLALVPRHPERSGGVAAAAAAAGAARVVRWSDLESAAGAGADCSQGEAGAAGWDVLVVDRIGCLRGTLAGAAAAFVGGSLREGPGGHNLLEVVAEHLRVITGPYLDNVAEQVELLEEAGAIVRVGNAGELAEAWRADLLKPLAARAAAASALAVIDSRRGAMAATVAMLVPLVRAASAAGARR